MSKLKDCAHCESDAVHERADDLALSCLRARVAELEAADRAARCAGQRGGRR